MNTEQAMTVLGNYLDMDEANRKKMLNLANNALETVRLQLIEYKRANRALVVEREELKGKIDPVITWVEDVAQGLNSIREANDNISTLIPKAIEERDTLRQQLAAVTAELDTLKAQQENREADIYTAGYDAGEEAAARDIKQLKTQIAAVPVQAIALYWEATYVDYGRLAPDDHMKVAKADEAVEEWIAEVKYGKREGWGGTPVTLEHPPDRSMEDADNDRFFGRG